jgi:hypothetical protein
MSRATWALAVVSLAAGGLLLAGCGRPTTPIDGEPAVEVKGIAYGDYVIGEPIQFKNLTVFPVSSPTPRTDDRYITLDEGLKAGTVEIRERGGSSPSPNLNDSPPQPASQGAGAQGAPAAARNGAATQSSNAPRANEPASPRENDPVEAPAPGAAARQTQDAPLQARQLAPRQLEEQPLGQQAAGNDSASVNEVVVINRSEKPLYLAPGDVMIGGQQDRVIGQEIVVDATGKPTPIPVFCVEHGRWSQRAVAENVNYLANVQANETDQLSTEQLQKLAQEANDGKFVKGAGVVTKDVRLAVQGSMEQQKVWDEVAKANQKSGAQSGSGAFTANYGEKEVAEKLDPYLAALQTAVTDRRNVVGVIVAINGKSHSIDVFESTPLFNKLWPKLLKSYALDAVASTGEAGADKACDTAAAVDFLKQASEAAVAKQEDKAGVSLTHRENDKLACFTVCKPVYGDAKQGHGKAAPADAQPAAPIHLNVLAK